MDGAVCDVEGLERREGPTARVGWVVVNWRWRGCAVARGSLETG